MALLFVDSFDHYSVATDKYDAGTNLTLVHVSSAYSRNASGQGMRCQWSPAVKTLVGNYATLILSVALLLFDSSSTDFKNVIAFLDSGTAQITVSIEGLGPDALVGGGWVVVRRAGTEIGRSTAIITGGNWRRLEVLCTVSNSSGVVTVRLDGEEILSLTGVDTQVTANAYSNQISIGGDTQFSVTYFDDLIVMDTSGSKNNTFLGDFKIVTLMPNAAGSYADFSRGGTDSGQNWSQVDEAQPTDDTDYTQSSSVNARDSYGYENVTTNGNVLGVCLHGWLKKDDAGGRSIAFVAKTPTGDEAGSSQALTQNYALYSQIFETGDILTAINGTEFGIKVST